MLWDMPHDDRGRGPRCDSLLPGNLEGMTRRGTSGVTRVPHRRHPARPRADQAPLAEARPAPAPAGIFVTTAIALFTVSAIYHLGAWSPPVRVILRRIDHANIFFLIAGTYTPLAVLALHGGTRLAILCVAWGGATLGVEFRVALTPVARWVYVPVYLGIGWAALFVLPQLLSGAGLAALVFVAVGGVLYTLGGVAYGLKRPDPWPRWFGFHEVFHACTVAAFACQYIAVSLVVYRGA